MIQSIKMLKEVDLITPPLCNFDKIYPPPPYPRYKTVSLMGGVAIDYGRFGSDAINNAQWLLGPTALDATVYGLLKEGWPWLPYMAYILFNDGGLWGEKSRRITFDYEYASWQRLTCYNVIPKVTYDPRVYLNFIEERNREITPSSLPSRYAPLNECRAMRWFK